MSATRSYRELREPYRRILDGGGFTPGDLTDLIDEWDASRNVRTMGAIATDPGYATKASPTYGATTQATWRFTWNANNFDSSSGIVGRWGGAQNQWLAFLLTSGRLEFYLGGSRARIDGFLTATTYNVVVVYDGTQATSSDRVTVYVNGADASAVEIGTWPASLPASTANITVGRNDDGGNFDGWIQCFGLASTPLSGSQLTAAHTPTIYTTSDEATAAGWDISYFNLTEASGIRTDLVGSNDLSAVGGPGVANGAAKGAAPDRSPVTEWEGAVNAVLATQPDITKQPTYVASGQNSQPTLSSDGVDDTLATAAFGAPVSSPHSVYLASETPASGRYLCDGIGASNRHAILGGATLGVNAGVLLSSGSIPSDGTFHIVSTGSGASGFIRGDGSPDGTGNVGTNTLTGFTVLSRYDGTLPLSGRLSHIIAQGAAPTASEIAQTESYLNAKYGVY